MNSDNLTLKANLLENEDRFIKQVMFSSTNIISNLEFEKRGLKNKNMIFFLNYIIENLSSVSMLGCRNLNKSLLGKIKGLINYYDDIILQFQEKDKTPKIPNYKIEYIKYSINNNCFIKKENKIKYVKFLNTDNDIDLIENLKLIYISLIDNKYFDLVSDELYGLVTSEDYSFEMYDRISILSNEYFALLIDYIGISIYEIKRIIKDAYAGFFKNKTIDSFAYMFTNFASQYNKNNKYYIFIEMDKEFDDALVNTLKHSKSNNYLLYSKSGLVKKLEDLNINNKKVLNSIIEYNITKEIGNPYYIGAEILSKDRWQAIKKFKQTIIQPFIGTMLYSGIKVNTIKDFIVVECNNENKFINNCKYFDDIFKPLTQDRIDYSDVFKRYIIDNQEFKKSFSDINKTVDEAVQLLPYYKNSISTLTKFTNTWFALETLFKNAANNISKSLEDYASNLVADRMISGYIYVTAIQMKKMYIYTKKYSKNFIENIFTNFEKNSPTNCDFLLWKYNKIKYIINNYDKEFLRYQQEAKELLMNAYYLRNKQFHGNKNSEMETMVGFLYDIVNDTIAFYIDYIDVYRDNKKNMRSLFNFIKNINKIKSLLINEKNNDLEKILIIYDSVRKI